MDNCVVWPRVPSTGTWSRCCYICGLLLKSPAALLWMLQHHARCHARVWCLLCRPYNVFHTDCIHELAAHMKLMHDTQLLNLIRAPADVLHLRCEPALAAFLSTVMQQIKSKKLEEFRRLQSQHSSQYASVQQSSPSSLYETCLEFLAPQTDSARLTLENKSSLNDSKMPGMSPVEQNPPRISDLDNQHGHFVGSSPKGEGVTILQATPKTPLTEGRSPQLAPKQGKHHAPKFITKDRPCHLQMDPASPVLSRPHRNFHAQGDEVVTGFLPGLWRLIYTAAEEQFLKMRGVIVDDCDEKLSSSVQRLPARTFDPSSARNSQCLSELHLAFENVLH